MKEEYAFQNIYVITTYKCNLSCKFCLFRFNKTEDTSIYNMIDKLEYSIKDSKRKVYIKITGGEPFLKSELLKEIYNVCEKYSDKVYKIGIGTNGTLPLMPFFDTVSTRTHIFLSRHGLNGYKAKKVISYGRANEKIDFRINCNLIKGRIDSPEKIIQFIETYSNRDGIDHFCFRQLNKVSIDDNYIYPRQIYNYLEYYSDNLVVAKKMIKPLVNKYGFVQSRFTGNYYDDNYWYWYHLNGKKISVKFRIIDEKRLIKYNKHISKEIDEYVIHPDGLLTGCWDKDLKIIRR